MAGETRLELAAFCVTGRRSDQLNYSPAYKISKKYIVLRQFINISYFVNNFFLFWVKKNNNFFFEYVKSLLNKADIRMQNAEIIFLHSHFLFLISFLHSVFSLSHPLLVPVTRNKAITSMLGSGRGV